MRMVSSAARSLRSTTFVLYLRSWRTTLAAATSMAAYISSSCSSTRMMWPFVRSVTSQTAGRGLAGFFSTNSTISATSGSMSMTFMELPIFSSAYSRSASVTGILRPVTVMLIAITSYLVANKKTARSLSSHLVIRANG